MTLICNSCKKEISNEGGVTFTCPNCGKTEIVRCMHCKELAAKYVCSSCLFEGPN